jgi:hypothetical protein
VIGAPPSNAGAEKAMEAETLPRVAVTAVGASGAPAGLTEPDAADSGPKPTELVAATVKVYAVAFAKPATAHGLAGQAVVAPPGCAVMRKPVMGSPPVAAGAVKLTAADASPAMADTAVGAPGTVAGVTAADGVDSGPSPALFVACTVTVYAVPFVKPLTEHGLAGQATVAPPGATVSVYDAIGAPPSEAGAVKLTVSDRSPRAAETAVGAPGWVAGVTGADGAESGPGPTALMAATANVYDVPFVNPDTVHGLAAHASTAPPGCVVTR